MATPNAAAGFNARLTTNIVSVRRVRLDLCRRRRHRIEESRRFAKHGKMPTFFSVSYCLKPCVKFDDCSTVWTIDMGISFCVLVSRCIDSYILIDPPAMRTFPTRRPTMSALRRSLRAGFAAAKRVTAANAVGAAGPARAILAGSLRTQVRSDSSPKRAPPTTFPIDRPARAGRSARQRGRPRDFRSRDGSGSSVP